MAESEKIAQSEKVVREDNSIGSEQAENVKTGAPGILDPENIHNRPSDNLNVVFENPLANIPRDQLLKDVEEFCQKFNLMEHVDDFRKGALVSQNPAAAMDLTELTDEEKNILLREHTHKWHQPWQLYWLVSKSYFLELVIYQENFLTTQSSHVFDGSCCARYG